MIKNIKDLYNEDLETVRDLYVMYFNKLAAKHAPHQLHRIIERLSTPKSEMYTDEMIDLIKRGERIGYAYLEDDYSGDFRISTARGLICGRVYDDDDTAWIAHLFVEQNDLLDSHDKKMIALELYKSISEKFSELGKHKVATEANPKEEELRNILSTLSFREGEEFGDGSKEFERTI